MISGVRLLLRSYLLSLGLVVAAFILRQVIAPLVGGYAIWVAFILAVLVSAIRLGTGPAIAATVASALIGTFAFVPPAYSFAVLNIADLWNVASFLLICGGILFFSKKLESQKAELENREARFTSETREQRLIDAAQDYAIYELDSEGRIVTWPKGAERLKGWKAEEIVGKPYSVLHTPESRAKNAPGRELKIAAETGRFEEEAPRVRKDGTIFAAHVSLFPLRDGQGNVTGFVKVTRDISDRSKAGKAILETRRRMEAIIQSAMDAIITIDEELHIVLFNPAAEKIFGYSANEVLGEPVTMLFPERSRPEHAHFLQDFFASRLLNERIEREDLLVAMRRYGEEFPIEGSISQVTVGGECVGTIILRDITERKMNEEARALLAREVDHRAKNALAVAQALVALTKADTVDAFAEAIRGRIAALGRAHSLLSQSQWRGAPLDQLIRDELQPYAKDGQLVLEGEPISCAAAAVQSLSLLFHELATNAVKHGALGRDKGTVTVTWTLGRDSLTVRWTERGGPRVVAPKGEGFGSRLLREVSGRQLDAEMDFDWDSKGLAVEIRLPAEMFVRGGTGYSRGKPDSEEAAPKPNMGKKRRRILVVEDEELVALEMSVELSRLGWAIVGPAATLGEVQGLLSSDVDAAVLDVNLRGRPVYPVAEELKKQNIPFLFCTGYETVDPEGRFPDAPVIRKPAHPAAISEALSEMLKERVN
jgi:PAS domain S-box-containing protein